LGFRKKLKILLAFYSLIRTFDLMVEGTLAQKLKEKQVFLLHFAHLFVPLQAKLDIFI